MVKLLVVTWDARNAGSYYVDKDRYSRVHERSNKFVYDSYCGTYSFDKKTKKVTLDDGVRVRERNVIEWHVEEIEE